MNRRGVTPLSVRRKPHGIITEEKSVQQSLIYGMSRPIILLGQILGVLSWDLSLDGLSKPKSFSSSRILNILYKSAAVAIVLYVVLLQGIKFMETKMLSAISQLAYKCVKLTQMSYVLFVVCFCLLKEKRFQKMLVLFSKAESLLELRIQRRGFQMKHIVLQCVLTLELFVSWTVIAFIGKSSVFAAVSYSVNLFLVLAYDLFVLVFFFVASNLCAHCFSSLNCKLNKYLTVELPAGSHHLDQIRVCYERMYEVATSLEQTFSSLITANLALQTVTVCLISYMSLNITFELRDLPFVFELFITMYRIYATATAAGNITIQAKAGLHSMHNIHCKDLETNDRFQIMILANKLSQCPVEISAAGGLFTINKKTFTTIMGTILTYLIVLMQILPSGSNDGKDQNRSLSNST